MEMKFTFSLNKRVKKFLAKDEQTARIFYSQLKALTLSPHYNFLDIKKMKGGENKYRLRIGKYRFLYEIIEDKILIYFYDAGSRGNIYKN